MCKSWKVNGVRTESEDGERFSDHKRRTFAENELDELIRCALPEEVPQTGTAARADDPRIVFERLVDGGTYNE